MAVLFVVKLGGGGQDDFFITYRYARSFAQGDGLVFNPGVRHFGATEPGLALLLGGFHRLTSLPIPWLGTLSTAFGLLAAAFIMATDGLRHDRLTAALLGGTLLVGSTSIWVCHGAAAPLVLASLLFAARVADRHPGWAGILAGGAVWLRPDAALGVLLLGLLVWYEKRRLPVVYGLTAAAMIITGAVSAWFYFGSPIPMTLAAKRVMAQWLPGTWPSGISFWRAFYPGWEVHLGWFAPILLIGGTVGWFYLWRRGGLAAKLLAVNGASLALAYPILGVGFYPWYPIPIIASWLFGFTYLLAEATRHFSRAPRAIGIETTMAIVLLAILTFRVAPMVHDYHDSPHLDAYREAALWIRENSPPNSTIAYFEVGVVGWYSERRLCDLLGLVTPGVTDTLSRGGSLLDFLKSNPSDMVLDHTVRRIGNLPRQPWFQKNYEIVVDFDDRGGGEVVIYRMRAKDH